MIGSVILSAMVAMAIAGCPQTDIGTRNQFEVATNKFGFDLVLWNRLGQTLIGTVGGNAVANSPTDTTIGAGQSLTSSSIIATPTRATLEADDDNGGTGEYELFFGDVDITGAAATAADVCAVTVGGGPTGTNGFCLTAGGKILFQNNHENLCAGASDNSGIFKIIVRRTPDDDTTTGITTQLYAEINGQVCFNSFDINEEWIQQLAINGQTFSLGEGITLNEPPSMGSSSVKHLIGLRGTLDSFTNVAALLGAGSVGERTTTFLADVTECNFETWTTSTSPVVPGSGDNNLELTWTVTNFGPSQRAASNGEIRFTPAEKPLLFMSNYTSITATRGSFSTTNFNGLLTTGNAHTVDALQVGESSSLTITATLFNCSRTGLPVTDFAADSTVAIAPATAVPTGSVIQVTAATAPPAIWVQRQSRLRLIETDLRDYATSGLPVPAGCNVPFGYTVDVFNEGPSCVEDLELTTGFFAPAGCTFNVPPVLTGTGAAMVPPETTAFTAEVQMALFGGGSELVFQFVVDTAANVASVEVRAGDVGAAGPVLVTLTPTASFPSIVNAANTVSFGDVTVDAATRTALQTGAAYVQFNAAAGAVRADISAGDVPSPEAASLAETKLTSGRFDDADPDGNTLVNKGPIFPGELNPADEGRYTITVDSTSPSSIANERYLYVTGSRSQDDLYRSFDTENDEFESNDFADFLTAAPTIANFRRDAPLFELVYDIYRYADVKVTLTWEDRGATNDLRDDSVIAGLFENGEQHNLRAILTVSNEGCVALNNVQVKLDVEQPAGVSFVDLDNRGVRVRGVHAALVAPAGQSGAGTALVSLDGANRLTFRVQLSSDVAVGNGFPSVAVAGLGAATNVVRDEVTKVITGEFAVDATALAALRAGGVAITVTGANGAVVVAGSVPSTDGVALVTDTSFVREIEAGQLGVAESRMFELDFQACHTARASASGVRITANVLRAGEQGLIDGDLHDLDTFAPALFGGNGPTECEYVKVVRRFDDLTNDVASVLNVADVSVTARCDEPALISKGGELHIDSSSSSSSSSVSSSDVEYSDVELYKVTKCTLTATNNGLSDVALKITNFWEFPTGTQVAKWSLTSGVFVDNDWVVTVPSGAASFEPSTCPARAAGTQTLTIDLISARRGTVQWVAKVDTSATKASFSDSSKLGNAWTVNID